VDKANLWLVIICKTAVKVDPIVKSVKANLNQLQDDHIWVYQIDTAESIGTAVSREGYFGEPPPKQ
jgi:nitrogen regulatory protein PII